MSNKQRTLVGSMVPSVLVMPQVFFICLTSYGKKTKLQVFPCLTYMPQAFLVCLELKGTNHSTSTKAC